MKANEQLINEIDKVGNSYIKRKVLFNKVIKSNDIENMYIYATTITNLTDKERNKLVRTIMTNSDSLNKLDYIYNFIKFVKSLTESEELMLINLLIDSNFDVGLLLKKENDNVLSTSGRKHIIDNYISSFSEYDLITNFYLTEEEIKNVLSSNYKYKNTFADLIDSVLDKYPKINKSMLIEVSMKGDDVRYLNSLLASFHSHNMVLSDEEVSEIFKFVFKYCLNLYETHFNIPYIEKFIQTILDCTLNETQDNSKKRLLDIKQVTKEIIKSNNTYLICEFLSQYKQIDNETRDEMLKLALSSKNISAISILVPNIELKEEELDDIVLLLNDHKNSFIERDLIENYDLSFKSKEILLKKCLNDESDSKTLISIAKSYNYDLNSINIPCSLDEKKEKDIINKIMTFNDDTILEFVTNVNWISKENRKMLIERLTSKVNAHHNLSKLTKIDGLKSDEQELLKKYFINNGTQIECYNAFVNLNLSEDDCRKILKRMFATQYRKIEHKELNDISEEKEKIFIEELKLNNNLKNTCNWLTEFIINTEKDRNEAIDLIIEFNDAKLIYLILTSNNLSEDKKEKLLAGLIKTREKLIIAIYICSSKDKQLMNKLFKNSEIFIDFCNDNMESIKELKLVNQDVINSFIKELKYSFVDDEIDSYLNETSVKKKVKKDANKNTNN